MATAFLQRQENHHKGVFSFGGNDSLGQRKVCQGALAAGEVP